MCHFSIDVLYWNCSTKTKMGACMFTQLWLFQHWYHSSLAMPLNLLSTALLKAVIRGTRDYGEFPSQGRKSHHNYVCQVHTWNAKCMLFSLFTYPEQCWTRTKYCMWPFLNNCLLCVVQFDMGQISLYRKNMLHYVHYHQNMFPASFNFFFHFFLGYFY